MVKKVISFVSNLLVSGKNANYNRSALARQYPGFGKDWLPMGISDEGLLIGYFNEPKKHMFSKILHEPKDVVDFLLYTREGPRSGIKIKSFSQLYKPFDKNKPTKCIIHGWLKKAINEKIMRLKNRLLHKYDANVFIIDWDMIAENPLYPVVMKSSTSVGEYCSSFLDYLVDLNTDPKNIHLIGHNMGAHVAGFAAQGMKKGKIGRITGLDPACPGFEKELTPHGKYPSEFGVHAGGQLSKNDAEFVDVIHTCAGHLGYSTSIGHADFYPNSGLPPQPKCMKLTMLQLVEACSHSESWHYFTQSLSKSVLFKAYRASSWEEFQNGPKGESVLMGDPTPPTARGDYYLTTTG